MKKIVVVFAMLALVIGSVFAADISASVEIGTGINFNTADMDKSEYFTAPDYDDVELNLGIEGEMFGAYTAFGATSSQGIEMYDTYAWINLGGFSKITIGDFTTGVANADYVLGAVDEYDLGILQYNATEGFGEDSIVGDELGNLIVDFYAGATTIELAWMAPYLPSAEKPTLNYGGRVYTCINDFADITLTATYNNTNTKDSTADERTTIGAFVGFPQFGALVGYTASIRMNDDNKLDHGIDLRAEMPLGNVIVGIHNNLSLYGDEEMVLYNEIGAGMDLTDVMAASLAVRSEYYSDGVTDKSVYDLGIYLDLDYAVTEFATISTGLDVSGIGTNLAGDATDVIIGIPLTLAVSF